MFLMGDVVCFVGATGWVFSPSFALFYPSSYSRFCLPVVCDVETMSQPINVSVSGNFLTSEQHLSRTEPRRLSYYHRRLSVQTSALFVQRIAKRLKQRLDLAVSRAGTATCRYTAFRFIHVQVLASKPATESWRTAKSHSTEGKFYFHPCCDSSAHLGFRTHRKVACFASLG
ncbi:hypothetical protein EV363DRAFT_1209657 [Boletus edulis]|nr:hypothetical protein EV363DRAFT_1209657 [Boletus edulis]